MKVNAAHELEEARRYIAEGPGASYERFGFGLYLVERKADARALGLCGLLRRESHPDVEIGFALLPQARRQGYALEAATALFEEMAISVVISASVLRRFMVFHLIGLNH